MKLDIYNENFKEKTAKLAASLKDALTNISLRN